MSTGNCDSSTKGSVGDAVTALQTALVALGFAIAMDEDFASQTEAVVRALQAQKGLAVDGICGPVTWQTLTECRAD